MQRQFIVIVTVTPNPAVDQTLWVERLQPGAVQRAVESQLDAAGKGVNVSRMAARLGGATLALGLLAGETGRIVEEQLDVERVQRHFVRVPGRTRVDVTIVERETGRATSVFDRGPEVPATALADLETLLATWLRAARVVVLAGSLPPGAPADAYRRWVGMAREAGALAIVDAEGDALAAAYDARPAVIKPNRREAEGLLGRRIPEGDELDAAATLASSGTAVVLSLGAQGAILASGGERWRVVPPAVELRSTIGSGDSMVAGIALSLSRGGTLLDGVRLGAAAGAATAAAPGTALGEADEVWRLVPRVRVEPARGSRAAAWIGNAS